jgi:5-methylcytosine-specific restriction enzyme B
LLDAVYQHQTGNHLFETQGIHVEPPSILTQPKAPQLEKGDQAPQRIWLYAPGRNAMHWDEFREASIAGIGWDYVGDLSGFDNAESIKARMDEMSSEPESLVNANQCLDFSNRMEVGDWIFVKKGRREIIGFGIVNSAYRFEPNRSFYKNIRDVTWKKSGSWPTASHRMLSMKTLTDITDDEGLVDELEQLVGLSEPSLTVPPTATPLPIYTVEDFSAESAIPQATIELWLIRLKRKQHLIFQGPPGTGKTYIAERMAQLLSSNTYGLIETTQFHPSYGYEDFMHGIRPVVQDGTMTFERVPGRFLQFCKSARSVKDCSPCVLIIDEINRPICRAFLAS